MTHGEQWSWAHPTYQFWEFYISRRKTIILIAWPEISGYTGEIKISHENSGFPWPAVDDIMNFEADYNN
jgi:hypothetical protein